MPVSRQTRYPARRREKERTLITRINLIAARLDTPLAYPAGDKRGEKVLTQATPSGLKLLSTAQLRATLESERHAHTLTPAHLRRFCMEKHGRMKERSSTRQAISILTIIIGISNAIIDERTRNASLN